MSIYSVKRIKRNEDVPYVEDGIFKGSPACASTDRHYKPGTSRHSRWRADAIPAPAATNVFIEFANSQKVEVDYVTFTCAQHGAPIKSGITRDSYRSSDTEWAKDVTPEDVARDVEGYIKAVTDERKAARAIEHAAFEAAELARVREGWTEERRNYNAVAGSPTFKSYKVSDRNPNEFGLVHVQTVSAAMTPNEARAYAGELIAAAGRAEDKSALARRP